MTNTQIIDRESQKKWLRAINGVKKRFKSEPMEMARNCAFDYYQLVSQNILSRTIPTPRYSKRYADWKKDFGRMGYPSPWRLYGDLLANLQARKVKDGWIGGVPPGIRDSGGKSWLGEAGGRSNRRKEIAWYGAIEEFGPKKRPLFVPTMKQYANGGVWHKRGEVTLSNIGDAWK